MGCQATVLLFFFKNFYKILELVKLCKITRLKRKHTSLSADFLEFYNWLPPSVRSKSSLIVWVICTNLHFEISKSGIFFSSTKSIRNMKNKHLESLRVIQKFTSFITENAGRIFLNLLVAFIKLKRVLLLRILKFLKMLHDNFMIKIYEICYVFVTNSQRCEI
ncbi:unnamed protein product [Moneuplotes crassus]|uniref:Uncharacterized protein n=1 Tax=Euplotes crassus TaxID=5936 RepID=A0AAD1UA83_EUPCR|nr:unnamed protein product [Moneuplotes crassus]